MSKYLERLQSLKLDPVIEANLKAFYTSYHAAMEEAGEKPETYEPILDQMLDLVYKEVKSPYQFELFHECERSPIDYYRFGLEFVRPLIDFEKSTLTGMETFKEIFQQINQGDNVILFANHQIEPDPQIISLFLEKELPHLAEHMIFVAGHRVVTDPLAIPYSRGRNLLCIYSKRYIENPPELKEEKFNHNQKTLSRMRDLLSEGSRCIYVAPSGGRDRKDANGNIVLAPFDSSSIEIFRLMGKQSGVKTHFYPLAMYTYELFPPPDKVQAELGEARTVRISPVHLSIGKEIDMDDFFSEPDKHKRRQIRSDTIWSHVHDLYSKFNT